MLIHTKTNELDIKKFMKEKGITFKMTGNTKKYYGIKDKKANEFCEIVENINDACMLRSLKSAVNEASKKTMISQYPEDYEVWKLFEVDTENGDTIDDKRKLAEAVEYKETQPN